MPSLVTHALFTEDVLQKLHNPMLNAHRKVMITGGQGPDFLFFHNATFTHFFKPSPIRKYGTKFHAEHINDFYASALWSIRREKDRKIREDMIAYVCGHLCHWALDSTAHPLIYFRTGNCKGRSSWAHHRYESLLDAAMLKYKKNKTMADYNPAVECLSDQPDVARALARVYVPAIDKIYGELIPAYHFAQALQDWKTMQTYLYDPSNRKKKLVIPLEKTLGVEYLTSGCSIPNAAEDNIDVCNLLHNEWLNPASAQPSTQSFFDLYEQAQHKAVTAITLFLDALRDEHQTSAFLAYLDDRNYEMDEPGNPKPVYFDPVDLSL